MSTHPESKQTPHLISPNVEQQGNDAGPGGSWGGSWQEGVDGAEGQEGDSQQRDTQQQ